MSEMIERVAKAMWEDPPAFTLWERVSCEQQDEYRRMARAAISAMREPTGAMCLAANPFLGDWGQSDWAWEAMIDAALKE